MSTRRFQLRCARTAAILLLVLAAVLASSCSGVATRAAEPDFTFVVLPDIQYMVNLDAYTRMWTSACRWVVENQRAQNIRAVLSVGDVTDQALRAEFTTASEGFRLMEHAGIPCMPIVGNHDYDRAAGVGVGDGARDRHVTGFDRVFGPARFDGKSWYGGNLDGSNANYYVTLAVGTSEFLILALEFFPRAETVAWASRIIDAHPAADTIILTHAYLNSDGTRIGAWGPKRYGLVDAASGEDLWEQLVKRKSSILAVISGHIAAAPHVAYHTDLGEHGNQVHELFFDFQSANLGDGWIGLLRFRPSSRTIEARPLRTYAISGVGYDPKLPPCTLAWP
jgi:hypothetical protein